MWIGLCILHIMNPCAALWSLLPYYQGIMLGLKSEFRSNARPVTTIDFSGNEAHELLYAMTALSHLRLITRVP